jgi:transcription elongation factor Elf1
MAQVKYLCYDCGNETIVSFLTGSPPPIGSVICDKCNHTMTRQFYNIDMGITVDKKMVDVANMMKNGKLPSGKDKIIF